MLIPMIVSSIFVLTVIALCLFKPNGGRIFLGIFFLVMAIGVNGSFTFANPYAYLDYAKGALIPFYRDLAIAIVSINPLVFGLLLMAFEITMGLFLLHKQKFVKIGLIGTMFFLLGIAPLSLLQLPWLGLIVGELYLFRKDFDISVLDTLQSKLRYQNNRAA